MRTRVTNSKHDKFKYYGGRGITICERWNSFENFLADMGERPIGMTLDRKENSGNYEPGNCRWATQKEQCNNRRTNLGVSGIKGIYPYKGKFKARIQFRGDQVYLGTFDTIEAAADAINKLKETE
jgi:hypothetical protein